MNIHDLQTLFIQKRNYHCENVNELIDFARVAYIQNEININDYRQLTRELEALGAVIAQEQGSLSESTF